MGASTQVSSGLRTRQLILALSVLALVGCAGGRDTRAPAAPTALPTSTPLSSLTPWPTYTLYPTWTAPAPPPPPPTCDCPTCTPVPPPSPTATPERVAATVLAVVDGDTIVVSCDGREERVRYLAIDCPEVAHDEQPADWLGDEATQMNIRLVEGQTVWLGQDTPDRDAYGRLLRWVWANDTLINAELVRLGYAYLRSNAEESRYAGLLHTAEHEAQQALRGLWAATPTPTPRPTRAPSLTPAPTATAGPCNYVGNANSMIFHKASCSSVAKMAPGNKVCFGTREEAIAQGYRACKICKP